VRFAACKEELAGLKNWAREGGCQLFYYDEAGFSASPSVQRAWSPVGCPHATLPAHHQRVAVMGALDFGQQRLYHQQAVGTVNREIFTDFMEQLIRQVAKDVPTFIILDNARIHHGLDDSITLRWMKEFNTFLCFIPPYSPELNMIEILWKQAKYHWREFTTWSKETFRDKIRELLDGFGTQFQIKFS
jgi:transposase